MLKYPLFILSGWDYVSATHTILFAVFILYARAVVYFTTFLIVYFDVIFHIIYTPAYNTGIPSSVLTPIRSGNAVLRSKSFVFCTSPAAAYTALHSFALAPICCGVA